MPRGGEIQHTQPRSILSLRHSPRPHVPFSVSLSGPSTNARTSSKKHSGQFSLGSTLFSSSPKSAPSQAIQSPEGVLFLLYLASAWSLRAKASTVPSGRAAWIFQLGRQHSIDHDSSEWFSSGFDNTHPPLHHLESHDQAHPHQFQHQDTMHATVSPSRK